MSNSDTTSTQPSIEERLATNDPTLVKLDLSSSLPTEQMTNFQHFVDSMLQNRTVQKIVIDFQWVEEFLPLEEQKQLLGTVGKMTSSNNNNNDDDDDNAIEKIMIFDHGRQTIDMESLASVILPYPTTTTTPQLATVSRLKALDVVRLEFCSRNDVEIFANAILNQHSLERFSSHRLTLKTATAPAAAPPPPPAKTGKVGTGDDDDDNKKDTVDATTTTTTLDPLFLALSKLPNLKSVCLSFDWDLRTSYVDQPTSLVQLCQSQSLRELKLWSRQLDDRCCVAIAQALRTNTTLTSLDLQCQMIGNTGLEEITKMMESNYTITTARTTSRRMSLSEKIDLYLRLNRAGRIVLVNEQATKQDWINVLVEGRNDIDILFYTIHCNPTICCFEEQQPQTTSAMKDGRRRN